MNPPDEFYAMKVFRYSITYLMALFAFLLFDHWLVGPMVHLGMGLEQVG
jgi:protoheme IX farnesyltransferase